MFCITAESCRRFSLAEILILAAMNLESTRLAAEGQVQSKTAPQSGKLSATQLLRTKVGKALQV
jgi:hypothetical protein